MESIVGRFHPLLVHLPIGFLMLGFIFEIMVLRKSFENLKPAIGPAILLGALSATASCIAGYFLSKDGGYNQALLGPHLYAGIATAVLAFVLFFLRMFFSIRLRTPKKWFHLALFTPLVLLLSVTGHLGGSLTHGEDFLSFANGEPSGSPVAFRPIANLDSAVLYHDVVAPILQSKCYSCHSKSKQKGGLRLDEIALIKQGGKHGKIIESGLADSSSLYTFLILPLEDERHMPPKGKPQPSSAEIAIIQNWINDGADFEKKTNRFKDASKLKSYVAAMQSAHPPSGLPLAPVSEPNLQVIEKLKARGIHVLPAAQDSHYVMVNFINAKTLTNDDLQQLTKIKDQVVWLSLAGTLLTDAHMTEVAKLVNLRWLYLNNTKISDKGLAMLAQLPELTDLNIVNTAITDQSVESLSRLKKLQQLFAYRTQITSPALAKLRTLRPQVKVDTGNYQLPPLATDTIVYKRKALNL